MTLCKPSEGIFTGIFEGSKLRQTLECIFSMFYIKLYMETGAQPLFPEDHKNFSA